MANILILGGTGAMGVHLVNLLNRNNGHCVTVTSRRRHKNFGNIMFVEGDAHEPSFLSPLLNRHFDVIVDFESVSFEGSGEYYIPVQINIVKSVTGVYLTGSYSVRVTVAQ